MNQNNVPEEIIEIIGSNGIYIGSYALWKYISMNYGIPNWIYDDIDIAVEHSGNIANDILHYKEIISRYPNILIKKISINDISLERDPSLQKYVKNQITDEIHSRIDLLALQAARARAEYAIALNSENNVVSNDILQDLFNISDYLDQQLMYMQLSLVDHRAYQTFQQIVTDPDLIDLFNLKIYDKERELFDEAIRAVITLEIKGYPKLVQIVFINYTYSLADELDTLTDLPASVRLYIIDNQYRFSLSNRTSEVIRTGRLTRYEICSTRISKYAARGFIIE